MAEATAPDPRILIASVGVGVPSPHGALLAGAVADLAEQLGYRDLRVENDIVSGIAPLIEASSAVSQEICPGCQRRIAQYPSGQFYRHTCTPPGQL